MASPLFVKYRTTNGTPYVYDVDSGEIVRVDDVFYKVVNEVGVLSEEELVERYDEFDPGLVRGALADLSDLQAQGILKGHEPTIADRARYIQRNGDAKSVAEFFRDNRKLIALGITEQCNLRCDYCCYGGLYPRHRAHGVDEMPRETAELAITEHIELARGDSEPVAFSFYGGEPLLNFSLVRHVIEFAEQSAVERNAKVDFAITTNGTLLTDEKIEFLVAHNVAVAISLDGPKVSHDRHRVFHDGTGGGRRIGSFDLVMRNVRRFVELYPDYYRRGIFCVLSPPYDLVETRKLLDELWPKFPISRILFVAREAGDQIGTMPKQGGCGAESSCQSFKSNSGACGTSTPLLPIITGEGGSCGSGCSATGAHQLPGADEILAYARQLEPPPATEDSTSTSAFKQAYVAAKATHGGEVRIAEPFLASMFGESFDAIHRRTISRTDPGIFFNYHCLPGNTKLYCDIRGNYFACEKCESTPVTSLGNVWDGFDPGGSERMLEAFRSIADCGNCVAKRHCSHCFVSFQSRADGRGLKGEAFDEECQKRRRAVADDFRKYTEILEKNPDAFDDKLNFRLKDLEQLSAAAPTYFATGSADRRDIDVGREELADYQSAKV